MGIFHYLDVTFSAGPSRVGVHHFKVMGTGQSGRRENFVGLPYFLGSGFSNRA